MTVRDIYESVLVEVNLEDSQSFTTEEFNYLLNKAILAFVNNKYDFYPVNQHLSDDLRVLLKTQSFSVNDTDVSIVDGEVQDTIFNPTSSYCLENTSTVLLTDIVVSSVKDLKVGDVIKFTSSGVPTSITAVSNGTIQVDTAGLVIKSGDNIFIEVDLLTIGSNLTHVRTVDATFISSDYLHIVSCRVFWKTKKPVTDDITYLVFPAKRLTYDMLNAIENNTYLNPAPNRPYYQVFNNLNNSGVVKLPTSFEEYKAFQNKPRIRTHVGKANTFMELAKVEFEYLKTPEVVVLKDEDIYTFGVDTSQVIEFPDSLKNELVKRCVLYLLEKTTDPRFKSHPSVNQDSSTVPLNMMFNNNQGQNNRNAQKQSASAGKR